MKIEKQFIVLNKRTDCEDTLNVLLLTSDRFRAEKFIEDCKELLHKTSDMVSKYHFDIDLPFGDNFAIVECDINNFNDIEFVNIWETWNKQ